MQGKIFALFLSVLLVAGLAACSDGGNNRKCKGTETPTDRLFLQQLSDTSVVIKWQGEATAACIGTLQDSLKKYSEATVTEGGHKEVMFTDLKPGITYFYSIGAARVAPDDQFFTTSPEVGQLPADANTRIWIIGDSGTGGDDERPDHEGEALEVLAGMEKFVARDGEAVDVFLMLGDNAYAVGSDFNFQNIVTVADHRQPRNGAWFPQRDSRAGRFQSVRRSGQLDRRHGRAAFQYALSRYLLPAYRR